MDLDQFLDGYEPRRIEVTVCGKAALVARHEQLDAELLAARQASRDDFHNREVARLSREVQEVEAEIEASQATFVFEGRSFEEWQTLKRKHAPTLEQRREQGLDVNLDTFALPAITACAVDPKISTDQAARLAATLPDGEVQKLFRAVWAANGETLTPKSVLAAAIERVTANGKSSITAVLAESLGEPSSADAGEPSPSTTTTPTDD